MLCQKQSEKNTSAISRIRVTSVARVKSSGLQINSKTYPYPDVEHCDEESMREILHPDKLSAVSCTI